MKLAVLLMVVSGAAAAQERPLFKWEQPTAWEAAPLVAAVGLIWVDVGQSIDAQRRHRVEGNPFLGDHPSEPKLLLVGGVLPTVLLSAVWYALPSAWRILPPCVVVNVEAFNVWDNAHFGYAIRF